MRLDSRRPFVGVDGEGARRFIGYADGPPEETHEYLLLRAGDRILENPDHTPLSWHQCLDFLATLPQGKEYVAYFFDYDVTMIMRGCREERVRRLLDREGRTKPGFDGPLPVDIDEFQVEYLPKKEFRVRKRIFTQKGTTLAGKSFVAQEKDTWGPWVTVSDTGTFFQSAFVKTLERWEIGEVAVRARIAEGKANRNAVTIIDDETREYNGLEIQYLEMLMEKFRDTCEVVGYVPRKWQGPGNMASTMLKRHRIPKSETLDNVPDEVWRWALAGYYGGRFETTAVGQIRGPIWQYDINSAYPYAITKLPCLVHGQWRKTDSRPTSDLWITYMGFGHGKGRTLCNLPLRLDDGSIRFPSKGRGWYWSYEVLAAERAGTTTYCDSGYWEYVKNCDCTPWDFVRTLYIMRVALGKTDKGMVLKLGLNSLYGKMAQSIGAAPYGNPINAGLITAITRATLIDAYSQAPDACFMLATDGIFMGQPLDLPVNDHLGGWDLATHDDGMFIIQPGLYFAGDKEPKTRGVPMRKVMENAEEFKRVWREWDGQGDIPSVTIPMRNFIGARLACARNAFDTAGQWVEAPRVISFDWATKRKPQTLRRDDWGVRTVPYDGKKDLVTLPYTRFIGGNLVKDMERLLMEDQPDWGDEL